ncbi:MAG TPA: pitrilysin family protein [Vicinamibacterales bacterium]|nr:pitrilysin family protein [Vicinamibacterales bacterium]
MAADRSRLPALGPEPAFRFPAIAKARIDGGLDCWTIEHHAVPVVVFLLLLPVGAAADPPDRPGLAALVGDMLDEGAGALDALEFHDALARAGAHLEIDVGPDATTLTLWTLARNAGRALALLGDAVARPRLSPADFERVRTLRLNRLRQLRDLPPAVADQLFARTLYRGHPYGHLPIGTEAALRAMSLDDAAAFHRTWYGPARATLIAAGDIDQATLEREARRVFESWDGPTVAPLADPAILPVPDPPAGRLFVVDRPGSAQSEFRIGHVAAPRRTPDYHSLLVLNTLLGGQFVSRINMNLREEKGYTYGARSAFDFRRGPGPFVVQASVQTDATAEAVRETLGELAAVRGDRPPTPEELALARAALTRGYPRGFETAEQIARAAAQLALYELPDDYFSQFVPRVAAVTADDVSRAARRHLDPARALVLVVGDRRRVETPLAALGLGDPVALSLP